MRKLFIPAALAALLAFSFAGCGSATKTEAEAGKGTAAAKKSAPPTPPATADAAVKQVVDGLKKDEPQAIWHALPDSYQKDVNTVLKELGESADADMYNKTFDLAKKVVNILETKKTLILNVLAQQAPQANTKDLDANWDPLVKTLKTAVNNDFSDLNKVKTLDVENFFATTVADLLKQAKSLSKLAPAGPDGKKQPDLDMILAGINASIASTEGDEAVVKMEVPGEPAKEETFVKVEGKWIPKEMASSWKQDVADARAELIKMAAQKGQDKEQTLAQIKMIEGVLDQIQAAKNEQELMAAAGQGMGMLMMMGGSMNAPHGGPNEDGTTPPPAPGQ